MRHACLPLALAACTFDSAGIPVDQGAPDARGVVPDAALVDAADVPDAAPPDATPPPSCPEGYTDGYRLITGPQRTWQEAVDDCANDGPPFTYLAIITSGEENAFVDAFAGNHSVWIGITDADDEGTFLDLAGDPIVYENWQDDEPNNGGSPQFVPGEDCGEVPDGGGWNDRNCTDTWRYLCECGDGG